VRGIRASHLRELVIRPVLERMARVRPGLDSPAAEELLVGTAAQESRLGYSLRQHPSGPARGIYQMEPATFTDLMRWLTTKPDLMSAAADWASPAIPFGAQLAGNLYFATAISRLNYYRKPGSLPSADDLDGLAAYWKRWWNTELGAGTTAEGLRNYRELSRT